MIALKFLRAGRLGPFSGFRWPEPGVWVRPGEQPDPCRHGVHACRTHDLPWWLSDELWEVELEGEILVGSHKLTAAAGRLRAPVAAWTAPCAQEFAHACAWRACEHAAQALERTADRGGAERLRSCESLDDVVATARLLADDLPAARISLTMAGDGAVRALTGAAPTSAYIAAHAAARLDGPEAYGRERAWQSDWLVARLELGSL